MPATSWNYQLEVAKHCYELHELEHSKDIPQYIVHVTSSEEIKLHDPLARAVSYADGRIYIQPDDWEALEHEFLHHVLWANEVPSIFHHLWMEENLVDETCGITYVPEKSL